MGYVLAEIKLKNPRLPQLKSITVNARGNSSQWSKTNSTVT
jgi:hypothetical protein